MKWAAEQHLRSSGVGWTIVRASAFAEMWIEMFDQSAKAGKGPQVFGDGDNPVNFVSVEDVAVAVARAATDPALRGQVDRGRRTGQPHPERARQDGQSERGCTSPTASGAAGHGSGRSARATVAGPAGPDEPGHGSCRPALRRVSRPCGIPLAAVQLGARPRATLATR